MQLKRYLDSDVLRLGSYLFFPGALAFDVARAENGLVRSGSRSERAKNYAFVWGITGAIEAAKLAGYGFAAYQAYKALF